MSHFNPRAHIVGKVYDLTQKNMCAMLEHIDELKMRIEALEEEHSEAISEMHMRADFEARSNKNGGC